MKLQQPFRPARGLSDYHLKMMFIIPTIFLLIFMNIFPLLWSLYLSFFEYNPLRMRTPEFLGTKNYTDILSNSTPGKGIWASFTTTAQFVALAVSIQFIIGFGLALCLNREFKYKGIVTTLILLPMMLSPVVVGKFWQFIFNPTSGLLNYFLSRFLAIFNASAENIKWLADPKVALFSVVMVDTWMWSPFMMLVSLAGLSTVPKHLYEAAEIDRASSWFKFRYITLPWVGPLLIIALLFRTIDAFKLFDLAYSLTGGGPFFSRVIDHVPTPVGATETISLKLYEMAFAPRWNTGRGCALAYIILVIIIALSSIYIKYLNKVKGEE